MKKCLSCFRDYDEIFFVCPHCGQAEITEPLEPIHLTPGIVIANRYIIGQAIDAGGFGIIYKAWDNKLETVVAVKEFFVSRLMTRAVGLKTVIVTKKSQAEYEYRKKRFLAEARHMAKFGAHKNIPNVFEYFEENNTAYIVMEYLQGMNLKNYLEKEKRTLDLGFVLQIANEVCHALSSLHQENIIHRDVAPDNIFIQSSSQGIGIKLMDLGAAKLADSTDDVIDIVLKPGYSPPEQYDNGKNIGPWCDIYALGATLYMLVTGTKPDESTNRKIKDTVAPPHQLNPTVPENLSNAIMKAMAVEPHMRFKNTDDFLAALNGERKVKTLAKEKKSRWMRRAIGITAAFLLLAAVSVFAAKIFKDTKNEQELAGAEITVWYSVTEGSTEAEAMQAMVADFLESFPQLSIKLQAIDEADYNEQLRKALTEQCLPALFESTGVDQDILDAACDIDVVFDSEQAAECLFLDQYDSYYAERKQVPLGIEIPVAFVITRGVSQIQYYGDYFSDLSDFGTGTKITADPDCYDLIGKNFDSRGFINDKESFFDSEANTSPVMLSSTMHFNEFRNALTNFSKSYVYYDGPSIQCDFTYEWSIGGGTEDEKRAAETLLSWMLGNPYQSMLMITRCSNGEIPINSICFDAKIHTINALTPIENIYSDFVFSNP